MGHKHHDQPGREAILPKDYYETAADRRVWRPLHFTTRHLLCAALAIKQGRPEMEASPSVRQLTGPAVVACTHRSWLDIPMAVEGTEKVGLKRVRPVAKDELYRNRYFGGYIHRLGSIGVDRKNPDFDGLNATFSAFLQRGENVLVYTEGTRVRDDVRRVRPPKRTASFLSIANQVPIVPMAIAGVADEEVSGRFKLAESVAIVFGEPIYPVELEVSLGDRPSRDLLRHARHQGDELHVLMQAAMDRAYEIRG